MLIRLTHPQSSELELYKGKNRGETNSPIVIGGTIKMNEFEEIEELKRRSKEKGLELSEEDIRRSLERIDKEIEELSIYDRIRKLAKMLKEENSKNERFRSIH